MEYGLTVFKSIIIASPDTEVFVLKLYQYNRWIYINPKEKQSICGKGESTRAGLLHELVEILERENIYKCTASFTCSNWISNNQ